MSHRKLRCNVPGMVVEAWPVLIALVVAPVVDAVVLIFVVEVNAVVVIAVEVVAVKW